MGLILDLAVVALAVAVVGSLALLAWTFGVSAVRAVRDGRERVAERRRSIADAEDRLRASSDRAAAALAHLSERLSAGAPRDR